MKKRYDTVAGSCPGSEASLIGSMLTAVGPPALHLFQDFFGALGHRSTLTTLDTSPSKETKVDQASASFGVDDIR